MKILIQFGLLLLSTTMFSQIPMYIEDKTFLAGEEITLDIWSDELEGLLSFQLRLDFENAQILDITEGDPFDDIPYNIFNNDNTINSLWIPADVQNVDVLSNETWFTLTIVPNIDGSTFDVFTTGNDPWSEIIIEDSLDISGVPADFSFEVQERNFLLSNEEVENDKILIHNNPVSDRLVLSGLLQDMVVSQVTILNLDGQLVRSSSFVRNSERMEMDLTGVLPGVYFLRLEGSNSQAIRFVKM